jgi:hypothetical protein
MVNCWNRPLEALVEQKATEGTETGATVSLFSPLTPVHQGVARQGPSFKHSSPALF